MAGKGGGTAGVNDIVQKFTLDATQYRNALRQIAKDLRVQEKDARDLAKVNKALAVSLDKVETEEEKLARATKAARDEQLKQARAAKKLAAEEKLLAGDTQKLVVANRTLFQSYSDVFNAARTAAFALQRVGAVANSALTDGLKYNQLLQNQKISIEAARASTQGLASDQMLLLSASKAATFRLGLNEKAFGKLARAATIAGSRLGRACRMPFH